MPTVVVEDGFEVRVLTRNEHRPPHVHVYRSGGECRIKIAEGPACDQVRLWDIVGGMTKRDVDRALNLVEKYQVACRDKWREIHGLE